MTQDQFCRDWIKKHFEKQPDGDNSLTWVVGAWNPFRQYVGAADKAGYQPFTLSQFSFQLQTIYPNVKGRLLKGTQVFTGVRYFEDCVGGKLVLGF